MAVSTLLDIFLTGASLNPDHIAVTYDDGETKQSITYNSLSYKVGLLRDELKLRVSSKVVGVVMRPGYHVPLVILGILSVPAAFYSIDPSNIRAIKFLSEVVHGLTLKTFIVDKSLLSFVEILGETGCSDVKVHELECLGLLVVTVVHSSSSDVTRRPVNLSCSDQLAYAITTSGTTGVPKIVCVPHKCIISNIIHISNIYKLSASDIVFQASPMTFDPSIVEIFTNFYVGASLLIVSDKIRMMPQDLAYCLTERNQVTVIQATPTMISNFGANLLRQTLLRKNSSLRVLCFGGECCPSASSLRLWRHDHNTTQFINIYGVTEVSCWATWYCLTEDDLQSGQEDIPLGNALASTELEVRNVDITGIGELWIGGRDRVCQINDEELTLSRHMRFSGDLVKLTEDGTMYYRGRKDDLVKRNGKRFHLQEVEKVAKGNQNVNQVVALYADNKLMLFIQMMDNATFVSPVDVELLHSSRSEKMSDSLRDFDHVTHVLVNNEHSVEMEALQTSSPLSPKQLVSDILKRIEQWLPIHCHPDDVIIVNHMPFTKHGKVDKTMLLHWYKAQLLVKKRSSEGLKALDIRQVVCKLWKNYVSTENTVNDETRSFIDCGGTSLSALCLAEDISYALNTDKEITLLLDKILHSCLAGVVDYLCDKLVSNPSEVTHELNVMNEVTREINNSNLVTEELIKGSSNLVTEELIKDSSNLVTEELIKDSSNLVTEELIEDGIVGDVPIPKSGMSYKAVRRLSPAEFHHAFKRSKQVSSVSEDITDSHLADTVASFGSSMSRDDNISDNNRSITVSSASVCRCLSQSYEQKDLLSVSRGSPRTACCHSWSKSTVAQNAQTSQQVTNTTQCCLFNKSQASVTSVEDVGIINLKLSWKYDTGKCIDASPLIVHDCLGNGFVYIGSHSHRFVALSLDTGVASWDITLGGRIESSAALSHCQQFLVVGCYDGKVYVIKRLTGEISWCFKTESHVKCSPCVDPTTSLVYIGSHDACLYALDVQKCTCLWKKNLNSGSLFSSPCLSLCPYQLVIGTLGGQLAAVNPSDGNSLWICNVGKPLFSSPVPYQFGYIIGCVDGKVYAFNHSGYQLWSFQTGGPVFSTACVFSATRLNTRSSVVSNSERFTTIRDDDINARSSTASDTERFTTIRDDDINTRSSTASDTERFTAIRDDDINTRSNTASDTERFTTIRDDDINTRSSTASDTERFTTIRDDDINARSITASDTERFTTIRDDDINARSSTASDTERFTTIHDDDINARSSTASDTERFTAIRDDDINTRSSTASDTERFTTIRDDDINTRSITASDTERFTTIHDDDINARSSTASDTERFTAIHDDDINARSSTASDTERFTTIRDDDIILVGSHDSNVYCLRARDGYFLWKTTLDSQVYSTPLAWSRPLSSCNCLISDDRCNNAYVATCSQKGCIYIMKLLDGKIVAKYLCGNETFSSPVKFLDRFVVGCRDNNVYAFTVYED